ncbi:EamA family transporter [Macrococcoides caseolyticum]|uniref:EamA family transporter n=1 Tax=Macrococcoides caseolyticum TaxID=69966 RepID=UPI001F254EDE|nr:EamA family transporter [Macrococcus caseolyticus]MCE4957632.1 EamA family transporter [Macrococcus caseolyticus]
MNNTLKGILFVALGATFWGVGGTVSQQLFQQYAIPLDWFITVRLIFSGIFLLMIAIIRKQPILNVYRNRHTLFQLIIYSIFGMLAVQYTFLASIEAGNAAVATLLQYLAPIVILTYLLITRKTDFRLIDLIIIAVSSFGTFLLLTSGNINNIVVAPRAIVWGLLSAIAAAFYTMYAGRLFVRNTPLVIIGWAMLFAGLFISMFNRHWKINPIEFGVIGNMYILFVIIIGTALAFFLYLLSVKYIDPQLTALLGCIEPLTAVILSIIWLKQPFDYIQCIGMLIILGVVFMISIMNGKKKANP